MSDGDLARALNAHYGADDLTAAILGALRAAGKDLNALTPRDLAPVDQFHLGGRRATLDLLRLAEVRAGQRVLDAGGGLGGTARTLALEAGCSVMVLDLTAAYLSAGQALTHPMGLAGQVSFAQGDATALPCASASFDVVWMQHSGMNIPDKARLYAEARRALAPGGRLALHEVFAGPVQPVLFPAPWAGEPGLSHLSTPQEARSLLRAGGWREVAWQDVTAEALAWWRRSANVEAAVSLRLIFGDEWEAMQRNLGQNLAEGRVVVGRAVWDVERDT